MLQSVVSALYPDSDGQPMADNTEQYQWIVRLVSNLRILLKDQTAFVAGDLLWYPIEANEEEAPPLSQAPDVMVVLGRPPGYRGSYKQWEEEGIPPQVVFEIISPSNSVAKFVKKQSFYARYGVLEMYFYDPEEHEFWGLVRETREASFHLITLLNLPWVSPVLGIRFELFEDGLSVFYPSGEIFKDPEELGAERDAAREERDRAWAKLRELGIDPSQL